MTRARQTAVAVVRRLGEAGHIAYLAGGCVRDELLGRRPSDYDVATDATPDRVRALFPRTNEVGAAFGVVLVRESRVTIEVTTFRREGAYSDKRRPDDVQFADAESDARRRDFTINALFLDPLAEPGPNERARGVRGRVIDYVGGVGDLDRRVVRAVGDPDDRLSEDHLRALRAARFSARLGFALDDATAAAVRRHARSLTGVSRERIGEEFRRMLSHPTRAAAAHLVEALGLDEPALGEPALGARGAHDPVVLGGLPAEVGYATALAAWALERAARRCGALDLTNPAVADILHDTPARWRSALCLPNETRDALAETLRLAQTLPREWPGLGTPGRKRAAAGTHFRDALRLLEITNPECARAIAEDADRLATDGIGLAPEPILTGDDLIAMGMTPGPALGSALRDLYDRQLAGEIRTPDQARRAARRLLGSV